YPVASASRDILLMPDKCLYKSWALQIGFRSFYDMDRRLLPPYCIPANSARYRVLYPPYYGGQFHSAKFPTRTEYRSYSLYPIFCCPSYFLNAFIPILSGRNPPPRLIKFTEPQG